MPQALIIIDMQNGVVDGAYRLPEVTQNILAAVAQARAEGQSVVWVQHLGKQGNEIWRGSCGSTPTSLFVWESLAG